MKAVDIIRRDNRGTYAKLVPSLHTKEKLHSVANQINIENLVSQRSLHTTVIYSRVECSPPIDESNVKLPIIANGSHFDIFNNPDGSKSLVVVLASSEMHTLHNKLMAEHNATYDYDEYHPHVTLSYDYTKTTLPEQSAIDYLQNLEFDEMIVEELILDWRSDE